MPTIVVPAYLHFEDPDGLVLARLSRAPDPSLVVPGAVVMAGDQHGLTWAEVESVADGWAHLRPFTRRTS